MEQIKIEDIKVGDKVILANGLAGKITDTKRNLDGYVRFMISFEDGTVSDAVINPDGTVNKQWKINNFYLIGTTILGNKVEYREVEQLIEQNRARIAEIRKEIDLLRRQAWRLRKVMTGEYPLPYDKKDGDSDDNA